VSLRRLFLLVYALSGAAGLLYEVAWTRLLTLQMGHTVAAASTVLAAYMGGMAVGSFAAGRVAASLSRSRALIAYALLEALIGG
jgi:spermidine synthase